jgi:excisionase family DNA binding protein
MGVKSKSGVVGDFDYEWINGPDCDPDDYSALVTPIRPRPANAEKAAAPARRKKGQRVRKAVVAVEPDPNRLALTVLEAAWLLNCSPNHIWSLMARGELPFFHLGRKRLIARSAVEEKIGYLG